MKRVVITVCFMLGILAFNTVQAQLQRSKERIIENTAEKATDKILSIFDKKEKKKKNKTDDSDEPAERKGKVKTTTVAQAPQGSSSQAVNGKYVTSYKNLMLGDQRSTTYGQFFIISTGECADVELAHEMQGRAGLVFFREYGDNVLLTFPGNAREASAFKSEYDDNILFSEESGGVSSWDQAKVMSGDIDVCSMSAEKFQGVADQNTWKAFNGAFTSANGGSNSVGGIHYVGPKNGEVYLIKMSNGLRALLLVKNVIPSGTKGGSMKFDIIVEGSDDDK